MQGNVRTGMLCLFAVLCLGCISLFYFINSRPATSCNEDCKLLKTFEFHPRTEEDNLLKLNQVLDEAWHKVQTQQKTEYK